MSGKYLYMQLERECRQKVEEGNSSYRNVLTALRNIKKFNQAENTLFLLDDENLATLMEDITAALKKAKKKPPSIRSARSNLNKLAELARSIASADNMPTPLGDIKRLPCGESIKAAFKSRWPDLSLRQAILKVSNASSGLPTLRQLENWCYNGVQPSSDRRAALTELEVFLGLEDGELRQKAAPDIKKVREGRKKKKGLNTTKSASFELPDHVLSQWDALVKFYVGGLIPATVPVAQEDDPYRDVKLSGTGTWTEKTNHRTGKKTCNTALNYLDCVRSYFKWLHTQHDVPVDELDLSLLLQDKLIEQFKVYRVECGEGLSRVEHLAALIVKCGKDFSGYLYRYHVPVKRVTHDSLMIKAQYPNGLPVYKSHQEWAVAQPRIIHNISETKREAKTFRKAAVESGDTVQVGGKSNVSWIIGHSQGVVHAVEEDLWRIIKRIELMACWASHVDDRVMLQGVAAWLALELVTPLRIENTVSLQYAENPYLKTSKLRQGTFWLDSAGDYRIFYPKGSLKNRRGRNIESVDATVPKGTPNHAVIERYLECRKEGLSYFKKETDDLFFMTQPKYFGSPQNPNSLAGTITNYTYFAAREEFGEVGCKIRDIEFGINPQSMRHIVAQYLLAIYPSDYPLVAHVLMDRVETVMGEYGSNNHVTQRGRMEQLHRSKANA